MEWIGLRGRPRIARNPRADSHGDPPRHPCRGAAERIDASRRSRQKPDWDHGFADFNHTQSITPVLLHVFGSNDHHRLDPASIEMIYFVLLHKNTLKFDVELFILLL
jgi:hypothetical protein